MAYKALPSQDYLNQLFRYEAETGILYWKERSATLFKGMRQPAEWSAAGWNSKNAGRPACSVTKSGYLETSIWRRRVLAHRVIWKMVHGVDPGDIDHINGVTTDNRLINIRAVSHEDNGRNLKMNKNNASGATGVSRHRCRWVARINPNRRTVYLGLFDSFDDAVTARRAAEVKYGFHENHGRR